MSNEKSGFIYICYNCLMSDNYETKSVIKCDHCGYRVFFKPRSNKPTQYEAV